MTSITEGINSDTFQLSAKNWIIHEIIKDATNTQKNSLVLFFTIESREKFIIESLYDNVLGRLLLILKYIINTQRVTQHLNLNK